MSGILNVKACRWMAISAVLVGTLCACSSHVGLRPSDIKSMEDSIIVGRIRFVPGPRCTRLFKLPTFELRNKTDNTSTSFVAPEWTKPEGGQSIDIPISRKATPGTYDIRIEVEGGLWDSIWLEENLLTLVQFKVPKGLLVYFGTIEVEISCELSQKHDAAQYVTHRVRNESDFELSLFKDEYPQIYTLYRNRVLLQAPQPPWKTL